MKKVIKTIIFLFIFGILFRLVFGILWVRTPIRDFYKEPRNSLDVVYLGSSNAYAHFNTTLAYQKYGFTTGIMAADSMPFLMVEYLIKESEKYQSPNLYVIDIARVADDFSNHSEGDIRKSTDSMRFSYNRIQAINEILSYTDVKKSDYINYYLSYTLYHDRWEDFLRGNLKDENYLYKGYLLSPMTVQVIPQEYTPWITDKAEMPFENEKILLRLLKYIKEKKLNVLFIVPKRLFDPYTNKKINTAISLIEEQGFDLINFNLLDDFQVDYNHDCYNYAHLNVYGSTKFTLYFGNYLDTTYNLKDHRQDKKYKSWDKEYKKFQESFKDLTNEDFLELLKTYEN